MMVFWIVAVLLILAALLFLLPPLIQKGEGRDVLDRDELNATIFKDEIAELDKDLEAGVLTQEQYGTARHDLEKTFIKDAEENARAGMASQTDKIIGRSAAVVIAVVVPILAVSLYALLGSGEAGLKPEDARPQVQAEGHDGSLEEQVRKLQDKLQTNPDDIESWVMLARSYYFMKQYGPASETFARASSMLQDSNPDILADYADALAMANGRNMAGQPFELVKKALTIQPFNQKALWLAGTATFQAQDYNATLEYWKRLLQIFPKDSDNYKQMQRNIAEVQQRLGMSVDAGNMAAVSKGDSAGGASINGIVKLDDALALNASIDDTLFVFARAANGPRMPLAIVRKTVKDLPLKFTLNDSMAMNPAMKLSNFDQVVVGARISKSGNAMPQSGDMEGSFGPMSVSDGKSVEIIINKTIP